MMAEWEAWFTPRLNLGLGNPNTAGAVLAMGLVSLLPFCFGGRWRRAAGLLLAAGIGLALAMTASRGALVALGMGLGVLSVFGARKWADQVLLILAAVVVGGVFAMSPAAKRMHPWGEDVSAATRWTDYSRVPAMIGAAPAGWGAGRSAEAYQNWFQPIGDVTLLKHVLSTHAIWLVERGWLVGGCYVIAWALAFAWCAGMPPGWPAGGAACWMAFAAAAGFSHVGELIWPWLLPLGWLAAVAVKRWRETRFPGWRERLAAGTGAAAVFAGMVGWGYFGAEVRLRNGMVEVSRGERRVSVMAAGSAQKRIGQWIRAAGRPGTVFEYPWVPGTAVRGEALLLVGGVESIAILEGAPLRRAVWLSPERVLPWTLPEALRRVPIVVLSGQLATGTVAPWEKYFREGGAGELKIVAGQGDFLTDPWGRLWAETGFDRR